MEYQKRLAFLSTRALFSSILDQRDIVNFGEHNHTLIVKDVNIVCPLIGSLSVFSKIGMYAHYILKAK